MAGNKTDLIAYTGLAEVMVIIEIWRYNSLLILFYNFYDPCSDSVAKLVCFRCVCVVNAVTLEVS